MAITDNLVSFWELEESSGTRADSVGGTNPLTDNNTVTSNTGKVGTAALFTAANSEYLSHASNASLQAGDIDITWAGWIYPASFPNYAFVFSKDDNDANREYALLLDLETSGFTYTKVTFGVWTTDHGSGNTSVSWSSLLSANTWYFVQVWHDATANQIGISINNGTAVTASHTTGIYVGTAAFALGAHNAGGEPYDGRIDQFGIWKRILTAPEAASLYNSGAGLSYAAMTGAASAKPASFYYAQAGNPR